MDLIFTNYPNSRLGHSTHIRFIKDFKDCFIASPVIYYDRKGKELIRKKASLAYADVTGMNYGKPYSPGSMELKIKEKVFAYADRVKEEEKERTAENR